MLTVTASATLAAGVPDASVSGGYDVPPHPGRFVRSAPLYAESVDGWSCHFGEGCRDERRGAEDPAPVAWASAGQSTEISCEFGSYFLLSAGDGSWLWAPRSAVVSDYRQVECSPPDWW